MLPQLSLKISQGLHFLVIQSKSSPDPPPHAMLTLTPRAPATLVSSCSANVPTSLLPQGLCTCSPPARDAPLHTTDLSCQLMSPPARGLPWLSKQMQSQPSTIFFAEQCDVQAFYYLSICPVRCLSL